MNSMPIMPTYSELVIENARLTARVEDLREALSGALDHLEYIDRNHPATGGWGVRKERISQARVVLKEPTDG